jgi:hypothetical protein
MTDTLSLPSSSIVSPHAALAALADLEYEHGDEPPDDPRHFPAESSSSQLQNQVPGQARAYGLGHVALSYASGSTSRSYDHRIYNHGDGPDISPDSGLSTHLYSNRSGNVNNDPHLSDHWNVDQTPDDEELYKEEDPAIDYRLVVRAVFDYNASDPSALSFREGDLIEVITRLESGWWDGMLGGTRGWFPSNYVEEVELSDGQEGYDDEDVQEEGGLEALDAAVEGQGWDGYAQSNEDDVKAMQAEVTRRRRMMEGDDRLRDDFGRSQPQSGMDDFGMGSRIGSREREETDRTIRGLEPSALPREDSLPLTLDGEGEDAWIPSLTPDGQVSNVIVKI